MSASQDECVAAFPRTQICVDRTYSRLLAWASYITAQPLPPTDTAPEKDWVQQRVLAERTPALASMYVNQIIPYMLETPNITNNIRTHLSTYNEEATETTLASDIDTVMASVMPKLAAATVTDQEVANWCDKNGYPRPPDLVGVPPVPGSMTAPMLVMPPAA